MNALCVSAESQVLFEYLYCGANIASFVDGIIFKAFYTYLALMCSDIFLKKIMQALQKLCSYELLIMTSTIVLRSNLSQATIGLGSLEMLYRTYST
jgi:hypothetical protein